MANRLRMSNPQRIITWIKSEKGLHLTLKDENDEPIAKALLTTEQLHQFICLNNKLK